MKEIVNINNQPPWISGRTKRLIALGVFIILSFLLLPKPVGSHQHDDHHHHNHHHDHDHDHGHEEFNPSYKYSKQANEPEHHHHQHHEHDHHAHHNGGHEKDATKQPRMSFLHNAIIIFC